MARPKGRTVPLHIRLAILYGVAALLLAAVLLLLAGAGMARAQMLALVERTAHAEALEVDLVLAEAEAAGQGVLHAVPPGPPHHLAGALSELVRHDARLEGAIAWDGRATLLAATPSLPRSASLKRMLPRGADAIGRAIFHPATGTPVIPIRVPPRGGDSRRLLLFLRRPPLQRAIVPPSKASAATRLIDLRALPESAAGRSLDADLLARSGDAAVIAASGAPLSKALRAAGRVRGAPWAVLVEVPQSAVRRAAANAAWQLAPWAVLCVVLAVVVGVATAIWVTYPLRRLTLSAERLASGDLAERTGIHRADEIGQLAATFDAMADELHRRLDENNDLYRQEVRRVHVLQALEEVAQALNATLSLDQVLETVVRRSTQLMGVFVCAITLVDENGRPRVRSSTGLSDRFVERLEDVTVDSCSRRALAEARVVTAYEPCSGCAGRRCWDEEGILAMACAPLMIDERTIGSLTIYSKEQGYFTDEQLHILVALAGQASIAVQNARLYEESQRKTREARTSFRRIGTALASGLRLDDTLALIAELACEMLHADACLIRLPDKTGTELVVRATHGLSVEEMERPRLRMGEGLSGKVATTGIPIAVEDIPRDGRSVSFPPAAGVRAYLGIPLHGQGRVTGVLAVFKRAPYRFSPEEIDLLASFGAQATVALENRRLYEQESRVAQTLQRSFLPVIPRSLDGLELGELYAPAQHDLEIGGDFYDLFPLEQGRVAVVMGDVCGKGLKAAVYTAMAKYAIRSYAFEHSAPSEVLRRTNRALCRQITEDDLFVSIAYAVVDPNEGVAVLASAGHPPAIHFRRATGIAVPLQCEGTLAGLIPHARYADLRVPFGAGDTLLFYTDGIVEARQEKKMWGTDGLARAVEIHAGLPAADLVQALLEDANRFTSGGTRDDIALLAVQRCEA